MRRIHSIGVQLALAMSACVVATVAMALGTAMLAMSMARGAGDEAGGSAPNLDLFALGMVAVASMLLGVTLSVVLARKLSRQIQYIAEAAGRLAAGDLSARAALPRRSAEEMQQLAASFNAMAAALQGAERKTVEQSAAIAHELRTPLAVLLGRVQGMQDEVFACDYTSLEILNRQIVSLSRLVDDLAVISLFSAESLHLNRCEMNLAEQVRQVAADMASRLEAAGLTLELGLCDAPVPADPQRVRQAISALLENTVRHASSGRSVRVETSMTATDVSVTVLDRGPGLTESELSELLLPFWRGAAARTGAVAGSGLGLSVVDTIVRAHGGTVSVQPRNGGGLSVSFHLPSTRLTP